MITLANAAGMSARLLPHGASLMALYVPDREGRLVDVVLGFDEAERYELDHPCFGATVGRVANRIADGCFTLDGEDYVLAKNDGTHTLHGGVRGFDRRAWVAATGQDADGAWVRFTRTSPHGEEGFPGTLEASVTYRLTPRNELVIDMEATADRPTLVNLAHHSYWNLGGHRADVMDDVLGHELQLFCDAYTPNDARHVPRGSIEPVAGTPYDFRAPKPIGRHVAEMGDDPPGYNVNFVVDGPEEVLRPVARLVDPKSGIAMDLASNQPGVQLYTASYLAGDLRGKGGVAYARHAGVCLETQLFPDAVHHAGWRSPVLRPGERYHHRMVHAFSVAS